MNETLALAYCLQYSLAFRPVVKQAKKEGRKGWRGGGVQEEWREDIARKRTVSVIKLENEWSRGNIYCKSIFFLETAKQQKCENKGNLQTRHRNPKWTSTSVYQKQRTSFLIEHAGDWLRDSVGLIVLYHLPKLQNLPGMWQFPTGLLTSRCVQECVCLCVCVYLSTSISLYFVITFFPPFFFLGS